MNNELVNAGAGMLFFEIGTPMLAAADNPFERVFANPPLAEAGIYVCILALLIVLV